MFDLLGIRDRGCSGCGSSELSDLVNIVRGETGFETINRPVISGGDSRSLTRGGNADRTVQILNAVMALVQDPNPTPVTSIFGRIENPALNDGNAPTQFSTGPQTDESVFRFGIRPEDTGIGQFSVSDNLRRLVQNLG